MRVFKQRTGVALYYKFIRSAMSEKYQNQKEYFGSATARYDREDLTKEERNSIKEDIKFKIKHYKRILEKIKDIRTGF